MMPLLLLLAATAALGGEPADAVDPFIGTGGHGHTFPGATLPFGMVQLSPDTRLEGWDGCSGYHYSDDVIYGFSHTHLSGTGVPDYADILFMPLTGEPRLDNGHGGDPALGYASRFDKESERAAPGWYAVRLEDYGIEVELTATERSGLHRYVYPEGSPGWVIIDLTHRDKLLDFGLLEAGNREIEGFRRSTGWAKDQIVHFVARFSRPFLKAEILGPKARLFFGDAGGELLVRVGISAVDSKGARLNLEAEQGERDFDDIRRAARNRWNEALGKIEITGGSAEQREIFYTALYHAMIAPNLYSDVDDRYLGMDGERHRLFKRRHYTVFSLWDTFRAAHPLYTLIETERTREFMQTFLTMYEQGGRLPVWELAANETDTMIGYHSVSVLVDAWLKGIRGLDPQWLLQAMLHSATLEHFGLAAYRKQGFIGNEDDGESVSKTLEYAYDDWCIARFAESIGKPKIAAEYYRRSQGWRHLLDPSSGFMRARRNQRWIEPFDPRRVDNNYTEANSWQYSFFVPHDIEGLIEAQGGESAFTERIDALFEADSATTGRTQADITGLIGQYAHGNEPSHHMAWLYHYAGRPEISAVRVRRILDELYGAEPDGLSGNEDCGQMSSWYVLAAIGLYQVTPCSDQYLITPPLFDGVKINLENGSVFSITTSGEGGYIAGATLNGRPLRRSFLRHAEIAGGGELLLTLSQEPGEEWGRAKDNRPISNGGGERIPPAPFLIYGADSFRDRARIELDSFDDDAVIRYTLDPKAAEEEWRLYEAPIEIEESTLLRFVAERDDLRSPVVESYLHKLPNDWSVRLASAPNPQYEADGPQTLVDGLRGNADWRTGGWLGFQYTDFSATVDLGRKRPLRRAGASFLQDQRSWIWMPAEVIVSLSDDGARFRPVGRLRSDVAADAPGVILRNYITKLEGESARYVRIHGKNFGTIPGWHPGRGDGAFIFIDEILID